jgi:hypothetical protein
VNTGGVNQMLGADKTAVKGEIFFIFFKDSEHCEEGKE